MTDLIGVRPESGTYRYLRARSLTGAKRYDEALTDYANTIGLQHDQRKLGEWVFMEMAAAYASLKQYWFGNHSDSNMGSYRSIEPRYA